MLLPDRKVIAGGMLALLLAATSAIAGVPTPVLVGSDSARARIVIYYSLDCSLCAQLDNELERYRNFLIKNGIAIEIRLLTTNKETMRRNAFVLARCMDGFDAIETLKMVRTIYPTMGYAKPKEIQQWLQWYNDRAEADHVFKIENGRKVAQTPQAFMLLNGRPIAKAPPGVNIMELLLQPYYEIGYLKEEYNVQTLEH